MDDATAGSAWFADLERGDLDAARAAIESGEAEEPADWPAIAVEAGFAADRADYYQALSASTVHAAREAAADRRAADDQQLIHAVRAMDDCERLSNELAERVVEWGASRGHLDASTAGLAAVRELPRLEPADPTDRHLVAVAARTEALAAEATALRTFVERTAPDVAPNLAAMAGPVLAARLVSLAGGLESLARMPSGTLQVLGAEEALFAHLRGEAPSPKHGVIYVHEYVRNTAPADRGSAARAVAGKLAIAARIDHYAGDLRPALHADLDERIARIRDRDAADQSSAAESGEADR